MNTVFFVVIILLLIANITVMLFLYKKNGNSESDIPALREKTEAVDQHQKEIYERLTAQQSKLRQELSAQDSRQRQELISAMQTSFSTLSKMIAESQANSSHSQTAQLVNMEERIKTFSIENEQKLSAIRQTIEKRLDKIQAENNVKLDEMRTIVTEKLNKSIDERMTESFKIVNDRLEQVYKGLGEMQTLAVGVGDLKKVLSNVKTRGILGEIQLGAILKEVLSPEQYSENIVTKPNTRNPVEFAIKLPSQNGEFVYLPIDSKFPGDTYSALKDAYDTGNPKIVEDAAKNLLRTIKSEAKDIHDKYISPPNTTDFAIMFLPFEGLYAEIVNRGMIEALQREYKVNIAGPSTMAALLNSLQMGFKTLAVQKRSSEVWKLLEEITVEFESFANVLTNTQAKLRQADSELDKLVGVRTRQMQRKLTKVSQYHDQLTSE